MEPVLLYITASNREEAISLAHELLGARLIACANVIDNSVSLYWWQGAIEQTHEAVLIAKTLSSHTERVTARVKELHRYSNPCVLALPVAGGSAEYIAWLTGEIKA